MMKAQFLQQWDGLATDHSHCVLVMGATNRPNDVDRAILRRMPASFHIPLPVNIIFLMLNSEDNYQIWTCEKLDKILSELKDFLIFCLGSTSKGRNSQFGSKRRGYRQLCRRSSIGQAHWRIFGFWSQGIVSKCCRLSAQTTSHSWKVSWNILFELKF